MDWICENEELINNELVNLKSEGRYLVLNENVEGYLLTNVIETEKFTEITPSWNSRTDSKSTVELFIKLRIENQWTDFVSYGIWATDGYNVGIKEREKYDLIKVTGDRIFVNDGKFGDAVQIKVVLRGSNPKLKLIAFTTNGGEDEPVKGDYLKIIDNVPMISQLVSGHIHSNSICSPTSLTMVLKFHGKDINLNSATKGTLDTGNSAYGNWPQNVAFAGEQGMRAYTKKCKSINPVKNFISKGIPVVASVVSKDKQELEGANSAFPHGHLMVVVGFEVKDGIEYIVVNDPAAKSDEDVRKYYNLNQWINVWRHYIYAITKE